MKLKPLTPDFSQPVPTAAKTKDEFDTLRIDRDILRKTLAAERRRHGSVETLLTRMVNQLEAQVADLRSAYFANLTLRGGQ